MLTFFTDPYPDELLYSSISRYHNITNNKNIIDTNYEIYGINKIISSFYLGYNLDTVVYNLGGNYTVDKLINNNTIFNYFKPFMSTASKEECISGMRNTNKDYLKSYFYSNKFLIKEIRYCPCCAKEDYEKYGESYFHVSHQLDGIFICLKHKVLLYNYEVNNEWYNINKFLILDRNNINFDVKYSSYDKQIYNIIDLVKELMETNTGILSREKLAVYYKNILYEKSYITCSGILKRKKLEHDFNEFYDNSILEAFSIDINATSNWWVKFLLEDNDKVIHPIKHLILINFLGKTIKDIVKNIEYKYNPFGDEIWRCINEQCSKYKQKSVEIYSIYKDKKSHKIIGEFQCENCGIKFSQITYENSNIYEFNRIIDYGQVWYEKLEFYLNQRYTYQQISEMMNTKKTIIQYHASKIRKDRPLKEFSKIKLKNAKDIIKSAI